MTEKDSNIEHLSTLMPESFNAIQAVLDGLDEYLDFSVYANNPSKLEDLMSDLNDFMELIVPIYMSEFGSLSEESQVISTDLIYEMGTGAVSIKRLFFRLLFKQLGLYTGDFDDQVECKEKINAYNRYRIPNVNIAPTDLRYLFKCAGLVEEIGTSTAHRFYSDPMNQMKGKITMSQGNKIWLKNAIKQLLENGMPIDRIVLACKKANFPLEKKKK